MLKESNVAPLLMTYMGDYGKSKPIRLSIVSSMIVALHSQTKNLKA